MLGGGVNARSRKCGGLGSWIWSLGWLGSIYKQRTMSRMGYITYLDGNGDDTPRNSFLVSNVMKFLMCSFLLGCIKCATNFIPGRILWYDISIYFVHLVIYMAPKLYLQFNS
jgi:hypothetical protein